MWRLGRRAVWTSIGRLNNKIDFLPVLVLVVGFGETTTVASVLHTFFICLLCLRTGRVFRWPAGCVLSKGNEGLGGHCEERQQAPGNAACQGGVLDVGS